MEKITKKAFYKDLRILRAYLRDVERCIRTNSNEMDNSMLEEMSALAVQLRVDYRYIIEGIEEY